VAEEEEAVSVEDKEVEDLIVEEEVEVPEAVLVDDKETGDVPILIATTTTLHGGRNATDAILQNQKDSTEVLQEEEDTMIVEAMVTGMAEDSEEAEVVVLCAEEAVVTVVEDTEEIEVDLEKKEAMEEEEDLIVVHLVEDLTDPEEADEVVDLSLEEIGDLLLTRFICSTSIKQFSSHLRLTTAQSVACLTNLTTCNHLTI